MLMPELPFVKPRKVIRALEKAGFIKIRTRGSHVQMKKGNCLVTIPFHNRDLNKGTFASILRQAHITVEEFRDLI